MVQAVAQEALAERPDFGGRDDDWRRADLVVGGFPCQDISNAGQRAGLAGARSSLWRWLCGAIRMVGPKYAIVENVAALLGNGMDAVLGDLAEIGYDTEWHCIPACAVGAPHERDRVWIIAYPDERSGADGSASSLRRRGEGEGERAGAIADTAPIGRGSRGPRRSNPGATGQLEQSLSPPHTTQMLGPAFFREQSDRALRSYWPETWPEKLEALCGVDDGVHGRVDGLGSLGNAVTPAIPEIIGRAIMRTRT